MSGGIQQSFMWLIHRLSIHILFTRHKLFILASPIPQRVTYLTSFVHDFLNFPIRFIWPHYSTYSKKSWKVWRPQMMWKSQFFFWLPRITSATHSIMGNFHSKRIFNIPLVNACTLKGSLSVKFGIQVHQTMHATLY